MEGRCSPGCNPEHRAPGNAEGEKTPPEEEVGAGYLRGSGLRATAAGVDRRSPLPVVSGAVRMRLQGVAILLSSQ